MDPYHITSVPLYLAMITNPKYKMSYIGPLRPTILQKLKNMLLSAAEEIAKEDEQDNRDNDKDLASQAGESDVEGILKIFKFIFILIFIQLQELYFGGSNF